MKHIRNALYCLPLFILCYAALAVADVISPPSSPTKVMWLPAPHPKIPAPEISNVTQEDVIDANGMPYIKVTAQITTYPYESVTTDCTSSCEEEPLPDNEDDCTVFGGTWYEFDEGETGCGSIMPLAVYCEKNGQVTNIDCPPCLDNHTLRRLQNGEFACFKPVDVKNAANCYTEVVQYAADVSVFGFLHYYFLPDDFAIDGSKTSIQLQEMFEESMQHNKSVAMAQSTESANTLVGYIPLKDIYSERGVYPYVNYFITATDAHGNTATELPVNYDIYDDHIADFEFLTADVQYNPKHEVPKVDLCTISQNNPPPALSEDGEEIYCKTVAVDNDGDQEQVQICTSAPPINQSSVLINPQEPVDDSYDCKNYFMVNSGIDLESDRNFVDIEGMNGYIDNKYIHLRLKTKAPLPVGDANKVSSYVTFYVYKPTPREPLAGDSPLEEMFAYSINNTKPFYPNPLWFKWSESNGNSNVIYSMNWMHNMAYGSESCQENPQGGGFTVSPFNPPYLCFEAEPDYMLPGKHCDGFSLKRIGNNTIEMRFPQHFHWYLYNQHPDIYSYYLWNKPGSYHPDYNKPAITVFALSGYENKDSGEFVNDMTPAVSFYFRSHLHKPKGLTEWIMPPANVGVSCGEMKVTTNTASTCAPSASRMFDTCYLSWEHSKTPYVYGYQIHRIDPDGSSRQIDTVKNHILMYADRNLDRDGSTYQYFIRSAHYSNFEYEPPVFVDYAEFRDGRCLVSWTEHERAVQGSAYRISKITDQMTLSELKMVDYSENSDDYAAYLNLDLNACTREKIYIQVKYPLSTGLEESEKVDCTVSTTPVVSNFAAFQTGTKTCEQ